MSWPSGLLASGPLGLRHAGGLHCGAPVSPRLNSASPVLCPDGLILVRPRFEIITTAGAPADGARKTVALRRCGASAINPYCDGTHKLINFRTRIPEPTNNTPTEEDPKTGRTS